ncbi:cystathionine beta-lyase [Aspergillus alliaceus]|uniref:cystathionine beta-lyase n=1 Tax=Petromyces alliaceus TaxID=209559 RepID=UPI0012A60A70|nr:cystathionine beta-lyase [Aspergillus alliaceus]KAB8227113.1 cystathionine beta-lyase [Aspergillus alliaceus]
MVPYYPERTPETWALGELQPPLTPHAVSASLPTWDNVVGWSRREPGVVDKVKGGYPRFYIHKIIQRLSQEVLSRLKVADANCMIFPSVASAGRCAGFLDQKTSPSNLRTVSFHAPELRPDGLSVEQAKWAHFEAVIYPSDLQPEAMAFWRQSGDGISSRHAEYALSLIDYLEVMENGTPNHDLCLISDSQACAAPELKSGAEEKRSIRSFIAELATSDEGGQLTAHDVFLFPKGLSAIYAVSRALRFLSLGGQDSIVVYGFPYCETVKCIELTGWTKFTLHGHGTKQELDQLEAYLESGERISALFCEFPSNPQLKSLDLPRLRTLADRYHFVIACDETIGTFVNVDVLPYVDIIMTSLTKIFSGASDVMGGSVIVNPRSTYYGSICDALASLWEDTYFPLDAITLAQNCIDVVSRVRKCSHSAEAIANLINAHPAVERVNYPSLVPTRQLYERCKRKDGGYGFLISIIFRNPVSAIRFYDNLTVAKGPSLGTNFTLAIPYALLSHFRELEWAASFDVPEHIVRISVGLEDTDELLGAVRRALDCVEM